MRRSVDASPFVQRFDAVRSAVLRMRIVHGVCWTTFVALCALLILAASDYMWELPRSVRATGLAVASGLTLLVAFVVVMRSVLPWNRPRTARELECQFPQLGQRVRTIVQFSGHDPEEALRDGVRPDLVTALEEETDLRAQPLDLRAIIPRRQTIIAAILVAVPVAVILAGLWLDWQWRLAIERSLLSSCPYTTLAVEPGDVLIKKDDELTLSAALSGRVQRRVTLWTRSVDDPGARWQQEDLSSDRVRYSSSDGRHLEYAVTLSKVAAPFDYRFVAGAITDELHHVTIRCPLTLKKFEATLTAPAYTGLLPKTVPGGNLDVIEGSEISFLLEFDREIRDACLVTSDPPYATAAGSEAPAPMRVPLEPAPNGLVARLQLHDHKVYSIVATAREGAALPNNQYRIRVRKDQPPLVHFEQPPVAWEVNPLAEVPMRIRVNDDFGLSKAGIVFQIDGGDEQPLLTGEYDIRVKPNAEGKIQLTTHAALRDVLCLEKFPVTEDSAVTYYAYVEDNHPDKPYRAETDLRFIEIRPFRRFFQPGGT